MQISMFDLDCQKPYKIKKHIRLIELFGGIGSQAKALENLQANFTHYRLCEFDKYAVTSYNAVHSTNFEPSDITKISAKDLGITETDKYDYILTYSFPCQDLSIAGKQAGMAKGSNTRSGLLWEVERLLKECKELPQVLLMENVPQVLNCDFGGWLDFLEALGYKNYYKKLNAKNFGIPQNRERCFMVSVLGNYYYDFPKEIPLKLRLKDMLESKVNEKYYITNAKINKIMNSEFAQEKAMLQTTDICGTILARDYKDPKCVPVNKDVSNAVRSGGRGSTDRHSWDLVIEPKCEVVATLDIPGRFESACRIHGIDGIAPACNTCGGGGLETKIAEPIIFDDFNQRVKADQTAINTLTTNCGSTAERNGVKIIEPIIIDDIYNNREPREYGDTAPTLRSERQGLKVIEPTIIDFYNKAIKTDGIVGTITTNSNFTGSGVFGVTEPTIWGSKQEHCAKNTEGVCPTLTEAMGMGGGQVPLHNYDYRIRKLTPKECWRLMGFSDKDFYAAQSAGVSNSQLYKQAGNSIVVNVLEEIFKKLF